MGCGAPGEIFNKTETLSDFSLKAVKVNVMELVKHP